MTGTEGTTAESGREKPFGFPVGEYRAELEAHRRARAAMASDGDDWALFMLDMRVTPPGSAATAASTLPVRAS